MAEVESQGVLPQPLSPRVTADGREERTPTVLTKDNFRLLGCMLINLSETQHNSQEEVNTKKLEVEVEELV